MTTDEIASKVKQMYVLNKQLREVGAARAFEEQALNIEYKVDECNTKRNTLMLNYRAQQKAIEDQIKAIGEELGG